MVKIDFINSTIQEDINYIEQTYNRIIQNNQEELPIVDVIDKKPGLDDINGKYQVDGALVLGKVSVRGKDSRSGEAFGYKVSRFKCNGDGSVYRDINNMPIVEEQKIVTKEQGLHLVQFMGSTNAYIRSKQVLDKDNNFVKNTIFLRPYPAQTQAFFLDGRVVKAYKTDELGNRVVPIELSVKEEDCTYNMWMIISRDFDFKRTRERPKQNILESKKENEKVINNLKKSLINSNKAMVNPFRREEK